jgi:Gamma-glutamyl cyclotransferase, AIG2-like
MESTGGQNIVRLFQYGSNMYRERFVQRIKDNADHAPHGTRLEAKLLGRARLDGWRLQSNLWSASLERRKQRDASLGDARACRVVNIVREEGATVWGALYEIASDLVTRCDGDRSVLDLLEGHRTTRDPENYAKICITVDLDGALQTAWTYIGLREAIERCERCHRDTSCDPSYAETVITGADSIGVPEEYLEFLRKVLARSS